MTPDEATQTVGADVRVAARGRQGDLVAEGHVLAYSIAPQVLIVTDDGERVWWRADMTEVVDDGGTAEEPFCAHPSVLERPESDTWECLGCGYEGTGS